MSRTWNSMSRTEMSRSRTRILPSSLQNEGLKHRSDESGGPAEKRQDSSHIRGIADGEQVVDERPADGKPGLVAEAQHPDDGTKRRE